MAAGRGDQQAVGELYDRHGASMYGLAMRVTSDAALAQDVVQDAFVSIWRNASRFDPARGSARTWIMSITHHRAIDLLRRRRPAQGLPDPELPPPASLVTPDIWDDVAARVDAGRVRWAMSTLSGVQREAIEMAYFGGLTQQEIALRTNAPLGTVKSRIRLGLLAMRAALDAAEPDRGGRA